MLILIKTFKKWYFVIGLLFILFLLIFGIDFYFLSRLSAQEQLMHKIKQVNQEKHFDPDSNLNNLILSINKKIDKLSPSFLNPNPRALEIRKKLLKSFRPKSYKSTGIINVWSVANAWPIDNEIYPGNVDQSMGELIKALQTEEIVRVYNSQRGTQLKLVFTFANNQPVLFKPGWYDRETIIEGNVYSGKDRHNSEIISFYLGAILNLRWTPIVVGRRIDLSEIYRKADDELQSTGMFIKDNQYCVYGKCFYCNISDALCGGKGEAQTIKGAILYLVPGTLQKHLSPWQRTYNVDKRAPWQDDFNFCQAQKKKLSMVRLLDIIDIAIFDYLIQNGDRHRHESRNGRLLIIDNGKGFGNPKINHIDILAPLYQCCILRKSTYERLKIFTGGTLTETIKDLTRHDLLYPLLTESHYLAMEARLLNIFAAIHLCTEKYGKEVFK